MTLPDTKLVHAISNTKQVADSDTVTLTEQNMLGQVGYQFSSEGFTGDVPGVGH